MTFTRPNLFASTMSPPCCSLRARNYMLDHPCRVGAVREPPPVSKGKQSMEQAIYDLKRLFAIREALETLDLAAPPAAHVFYPETAPPFRRVGILCGSFNPLTLAHTELAERARETCQLECVFFTLAKVTVDKEQVTGLGLEDRLLLLSLYAQGQSRTGVALV